MANGGKPRKLITNLKEKKLFVGRDKITQSEARETWVAMYEDGLEIYRRHPARNSQGKETETWYVDVIHQCLAEIRF